MDNVNKKFFIEVIFYLALAILTFSIALYGLLNQEVPSISFKGNEYEFIEDGVYQSKNNEKIYINTLNQSKTIIEIVGDEAVIEIYTSSNSFRIEKNGKIYNSGDEIDPFFNDYIELVDSFYLVTSFMDEFPEFLFISFLAIIAFISGAIFIHNILNDCKKTGSFYIINAIIITIYIFSLILLINMVIKTT